MPLPIRPNHHSSNFDGFDLSMLFNGLSSLPIEDEATPSNNKIVTASDSDAKKLMDVWRLGKKNGQYRYQKNEKISENDFISLKRGGFVDGQPDDFTITWRGQRVIKHMTLSENNAFLKNKKEKKYTEIIASSKKTKKSGYKIASIENPENAKTTFIHENRTYEISYEQWLKLGKQFGID